MSVGKSEVWYLPCEKRIFETRGALISQMQQYWHLDVLKGTVLASWHLEEDSSDTLKGTVVISWRVERGCNCDVMGGTVLIWCERFDVRGTVLIWCKRLVMLWGEQFWHNVKGRWCYLQVWRRPGLRYTSMSIGVPARAHAPCDHWPESKWTPSSLSSVWNGKMRLVKHFNSYLLPYLKIHYIKHTSANVMERHVIIETV